LLVSNSQVESEKNESVAKPAWPNQKFTVGFDYNGEESGDVTMGGESFPDEVQKGRSGKGITPIQSFANSNRGVETRTIASERK